MRKDSKQRRRLICVIRPALTRSTPQFKIIAQPCASHESEQSESVIRWCENEESAENERKPGKGLVKGRDDEEYHETEEGDKGNPIEGFENLFPFVPLGELCG